MSTGNLNFSINNLPKVDHQLNDSLKAPHVNQVQNAEITQNESVRKLMMPVEVARTEQEIIDPKDHKKKHKTIKQKHLKKKPEKKNISKKKKQKNSGFFIDLEG